MKLPIHLSTVGAAALLFVAFPVTPRIYAADGDTADKKEDTGDKKDDKKDDKDGKKKKKHDKKKDEDKKTDDKKDDTAK
jgi:hypothetical protein